MRPVPLTAEELDLLRTVFRRHREIVSASLFGSRARGTHTERSDVDLVLTGDMTLLAAEAVAAELDELPLPYKFDVHALKHISYDPLLDQILEAGIVIYPQ